MGAWDPQGLVINDEVAVGGTAMNSFICRLVVRAEGEEVIGLDGRLNPERGISYPTMSVSYETERFWLRAADAGPRSGRNGDGLTRSGIIFGSGLPQLNDLACLSTCHGVVDMLRNPIGGGK
jgi:hypothetical protein